MRNVPMKRTHIVWFTLIAGMTGVGGLLLALEDRKAVVPAALAAFDSNAPETASGELAEIFARVPALDSDKWTDIVIHHSGSLGGSAETIDREHRINGLNGLGYHFVIGNGQGSVDGAIEVGARWVKQASGAHTAGPQATHFNNHGVGICLVGDGERRRFTEAQLVSLEQLVSALSTQLGIDPSRVVMHRDVAPTSSPGRLFPENALRRKLSFLN